MPLVESGYHSGSQDSEGRPPHRPLRVPHRRQSFAPRSEEEEAQEGVAENVAALTNVEVPVFEASMAETEQKMQQGIEEPTGRVG